MKLLNINHFLKILLFTIFLFSLNPSFGQINNQNKKIKQVKLVIYHYIEKEEIPPTTIISNYDKKGNLVEELSYINTGELLQKITYKYDSIGSMLQKIIYMPYDTTDIIKTLYDYDNSGKLKRESVFSDKLELYRKEFYYKDEKNYTIRIYDLDSLTQYQTFISKGNLEVSKTFDASNFLINQIVRKYDKEHRLIKYSTIEGSSDTSDVFINHYSESESFSVKKQYVYNELKNKFLLSSKNVFFENEIIEETYYNDLGEIEEINNYGYLKKKITYHNKSSIYDRKIFNSTSIYRYNEKNFLLEEHLYEKGKIQKIKKYYYDYW